MDHHFVERYETDQQAWNAGYELLMRLRILRSPERLMHTSQQAEAAIRTFAQSIRQSEPSLLLPRIQRQFHVPDEGMVMLVYAMAAYWGVGVPAISCRIHEAAVWAVGFQPSRLRRLFRAIRAKRGYCELLHRDDQYIRISLEFDKALGTSPISNEDISAFKTLIDSLPNYLSWDEFLS